MLCSNFQAASDYPIDSNEFTFGPVTTVTVNSTSSITLVVQRTYPHSMIVRFLTGRFIGDYDPHMDAIFDTHIPVDGKHFTAHIMDTTQAQDFNTSCESDCREEPVSWADGFLLVFSLTDRGSFTVVREMVSWLRTARGDERLPILVAGNKNDLVHLRCVSRQDCEAWASEHGVLFFEVRIRKGSHVEGQMTMHVLLVFII
ncbi:Ras-like GTP-binding protein Rho1 [Elysia marginata]|uniref:small monomeric GTPase n=1 Tax=Elysia marginata TaxID=1093978 RepID=A0AAV4FSC1_9GAST|nr:Ras-like GTP-binding protein Rho1 [Elysia marginata]